MSIYVIADLHLSFATNKPMDIFGDNWENHSEKIESNWRKIVKEDDVVLLPGDFSWGINFEEAKLDFDYLNSLPGRKIMLKGNHDYWWGTTSKIYEFFKKNNYENIDILYNNSYLIENKIICGTRGWNLVNFDEENERVYKRELLRLELSIKDGIKKFGEDKEIIVCMHYPPTNLEQMVNSEFMKIMQKYNVKKCFYGHLHGKAHSEAVEGNLNGIEIKLVSSDYTNFELVKIK